MKKFFFFLIGIISLGGVMFFLYFSSGVTSSTPWTREKAEHLASTTLFYADSGTVDRLFQAGSAEAAVEILFPDRDGPDRTLYNQALMSYTSSGFNWDNQTHANRYYQMKYVLDPYESKRKLFSLFEDIYAVNRGDTISYQDISDQHDLLYRLMFGSYEVLVKRLLYNNGSPGDYAEGAFLNLFNQTDPNNPNENYARELLQLFLMGEYEPYKNKENNDERNYSESDVRALARLLTGLKADPLTHQVSIDPLTHYTGASVVFLSGSLPMNYMPPFYNQGSGTIDSSVLLSPYNGNNGLTDNVIEYIFAQRGRQIALFLADRIYRFYIHDTPSRQELDMIASVIESENFDIYSSVKKILTLDMMYSEKSLREMRYKTPLELYIGTLKKMQVGDFSRMLLDPNLFDTNILPRLNWTPYFPGSVFGRDGFDDSLKWNNTSIQNGWTTLTHYFTYRSSGTGVIDFRLLLPSYRRELTTERISLFSHADNSYTGTMTVASGTILVQSGVQVVLSGDIPMISFRAFSEEQFGVDVSFSQDTREENIATVVGTEKKSTDNFSEVDLGDIVGGFFDELDPNGIRSENSLDPYMIVGASESDSFLPRETKNIPSLDETLSPPDVPSTTEDILSGATFTGSENTELSLSGIEDTSSGSDSVPVDTSIDSKESQDTSSGITLGSGSIEEILVDISPLESEVRIAAFSDPMITVTSSENLSLSDGTVSFPTFQIMTSSGTIRIFSGTYDSRTRTLFIHSGALMNGQTGSLILNSEILFTPESRITADMITVEQIYDVYSRFILGERTLPLETKSQMIQFLSTDTNGNIVPIAPQNTNYFNTRVRGLLSLLLASPEYVIRKGWNLQTDTSASSGSFLDSSASKILFIEFGGGNDYLSSVIPQDEYEAYREMRTNQSGTIALPRESLVPIGDYYLNPFLAYGTGTNPGFKSLYDAGYMKFFNRVGTLRHSQDHSAASFQMSSFGNTTDERADGIFGHLITREANSLNTISLGARLPNVYRSGRFVNMGGDIIISNPFNSRYTAHLDLLSRIAGDRLYPGETGDMFRNAIAISDSAKISVGQGGPRGATGDMYRVFDFLKILLQNNIGKSYYMSARGGYDTHENQYNALNSNLRFVADSVTQFFNSVKDTQDITIVLYSEFGRTNKVNTTLGTDHGDGGGIYVISSNTALRNALPNGTYGNMILEYLRYPGLGVGIDYRSVYGKLYEALYGLSSMSLFPERGVNLEKNISLEKNELSLKNITHRIAYGNVLYGYLTFVVQGENYDQQMAGYTTISAGTGVSSLQNIWDTRNVPGTFSGQYRYSATLVSDRQSIYRIRSLSNQYINTEYLGNFTGSLLPMILPRNIYQVSLTGSSLLSAYSDLTVPLIFSNTGILLSQNESGEVVDLPGKDFAITFASGITRGIELTYTTSGSTKWYGGFIMGESIDPSTFWSPDAYESGTLQGISKENIARIQKIGPDRLGIGMKLNQGVMLTFKNVPTGSHYRILSSEDGVVWTNISATGAYVTPDQNNAISFWTDHFSYFALATESVVESPSCMLSASPRSIQDGQTVLLSYGVSHVQSGTLSPLGLMVSTTGSLTINPPASSTTTYILTVEGGGRLSTCQVSVTSILSSSSNTGSTSTGVIVPSPPPSNIGTSLSITGPGGGSPGVALSPSSKSDQSGVKTVTYTQQPVSYNAQFLSVGLLDHFLDDSAFDRIFTTPGALHKKIAFLVRIARYDILRGELLGSRMVRSDIIASLDTRLAQEKNPDKGITMQILRYYIRFMKL